METTEDGRSVILGMGDGSMTTLSIADPSKENTVKYLAELPSRNPSPEGEGAREDGGKNEDYLQNGNSYPSPYEYSIYTDYLKALHAVIPKHNI